MDDARYMAMTPAARGMLMNLVWQFWATDCAPLPKDDDRLFVLAQAHRPTWRAYRQTIVEIVREVEPKLKARFEAHHNRKAALMRLSERGGGVGALKALRKAAPPELQALAPSLGPERRSERRPRVIAPGDDGKLFK